MKISRNCLVCNTEFKTTQWHIDNGKGKFCSVKCYHISLRSNVDKRFWKSVEKTDSCWFWKGSLNTKGYGQFYVHLKNVPAHRYSYFLHFSEIPKGMFVLHNCIGKRNCVNPSHLRLGTHRDNMDDKVQQGRQNRGSSDGNSKLSEEEVIEIRKMSGTVSPSQLAMLYKVSYSTIHRIVYRLGWKHV